VVQGKKHHSLLHESTSIQKKEMNKEAYWFSFSVAISFNDEKS
jgi:hypothetical protein